MYFVSETVSCFLILCVNPKKCDFYQLDIETGFELAIQHMEKMKIEMIKKNHRVLI